MSKRDEITDLQAWLRRAERRFEDIERRNTLPPPYRFELRNNTPVIIDTRTGQPATRGPASGSGLIRHAPLGPTTTTDTIDTGQPDPPATSTLALHAATSNQATTLDPRYTLLYSVDTMHLASQVTVSVPETLTVNFAPADQGWMHTGAVIHNVASVDQTQVTGSITGAGPHTFPTVTIPEDVLPSKPLLVVYLLHTGDDGGNTTHILQPPTPTELWDSSHAAEFGDLAAWYEHAWVEGVTEAREVVLDGSRRCHLTTLLCTPA